MLSAVDSVELELRGPDGRATGQITLSLLPNQDHALPPILVGDDPDHAELERVQLLEGCEYRYQLDAPMKLGMWLEPAEVFSPDKRGALSGRMRVRLATGRVPIRLAAEGHWLGETAVEVRSLKLDYLDDYRRMLDDLVTFGAELVLQRFAPSEQRLKIDPESKAESTYQRFCFLRSIIRSERMEGALARILRQPFVEWRDERTTVPPGRGMRAGRDVARALTRPGHKIRNENAESGALRLLPMTIETGTFEESVDNVPNRFVRFVLEDWRNEVAELGDVIQRRAQIDDSSVLRRAAIEISAVSSALDDTLRAPLFADVGRLGEAPGANQVLQRRSGYREIVEAYVLSRFASVLAWSGGEDIFGAGQRNVATLYEYWVFMQLVRIAAKHARDEVDLSTLFHPTKEGAELRLRHGTESGVTMVVVRAGVPMRLDVTFNRTYSAGVGGDSWTRTMKPDCSMEITPLARRFDEPVRVHFDAKYRVDDVSDLFGDLQDVSAHREDLLKMHAYRDAIVRAAGAYVVYPGKREEVAAKYTEILPGLGAFALRPGTGGVVEGEEVLGRFLGRVLDHIASQATRRSRAQYWQLEANRGDQGAGSGVEGNVDWLMKPPADTHVLLGFVKSAEHLAWVRDSGMYNLRADDRSGAVTSAARELSAEILLLYGDALGRDINLYGISGAPRLLTADAMRANGYPNPRGALYFCLQLGARLPEPDWLTRDVVDRILAAREGHILGAPVASNVLDLMRSVQ